MLFDRWRQRVLPQGHIGATWRIRLNLCILRTMRVHNRNGKWIDLPFLHSLRQKVPILYNGRPYPPELPCKNLHSCSLRSVAWYCNRSGFGLAIFSSHVQSQAIHCHAVTLGKSRTRACLQHAIFIGTSEGHWCSEAGKVTTGLAYCWVWPRSPAGCLHRKPEISTSPHGPLDHL